MAKNLYVGDPAPDFDCTATTNPRFYFNLAAGRYVVLSFIGSLALDKNAKAYEFITGKLAGYFDDFNISFFGVTIDPADVSQERIQPPKRGYRFFLDFERKVSSLYGAVADNTGDSAIVYSPFTLVLDPNLRILAKISLTDAEQHNRALESILSSLPEINSYAEVPLNAPVLVIPRVLEPSLCKMLIDLYEKHGGTESGSMLEKDGYTVGRIDHSFKRRKDYDIEDEEVREAIRQRISRRIVPEIRKAFQFNATHIELYIVACYDGENNGFFRPHRDNTTKGTAHRRFACTINLNAEQFEGGELRFPEFGNKTYRAPTGGAVVFSCSLLHEATPVTKGKRYATLPFLYDFAAAKIREENMKYVTGEVTRADSDEKQENL